MSHYTRMQKGETSVVRKGGWFSSGDNGSKDAGASQANSIQPSMTSHLHSIADRHSSEGQMHGDVSQKLGYMGMDKQSAAGAGEGAPMAGGSPAVAQGGAPNAMAAGG